MFALTATPATPPPDNSVVAGPIGFTVFILLILATAFICWNFTKQLKKGVRIRLNGLGILQVRKRAARMGRNPATGEAIKIKASKKVAFRASKELKQAV